MKYEMSSIRLTKEQTIWLKKIVENEAKKESYLVGKNISQNTLDEIEHAKTILYKIIVEEEHR